MSEPRKNYGRRKVARTRAIERSSKERLRERIDLLLRRKGNVTDAQIRLKLVDVIDAIIEEQVALACDANATKGGEGR